MSDVFLVLTSDPLFPKAGERFKVTAKLKEPAASDLSITFEKHRVNVDQSGTHALCPILQGYFTDDGYPDPIELKKGRRKAATSVKVSSNAKNPHCPPPERGGMTEPVLFPDRLMLTVFVTSVKPPTGPLIGKAHLVVTIRAPK